MTINTKRLRELAEAATQPGPWTVKRDGSNAVGDDTFTVLDANGFWVADVGEAPHDAAFIAAANPQTVIALLDDLQACKDGASMMVARVQEESTSWRLTCTVLRKANDGLQQQLTTITADRDALRAEVERLRAVATDIEMQRHATAKARDQALAALDYLAFWKGRDQHHANAEEIAAGNMVIGEDGEAEPRGAK